MSLLEVRDLNTFFRTKHGIVKAVNGVSYTVEAGKTLGIVGESGSGKTVSAMSILQLLDTNGFIESGSIKFDGRELTWSALLCRTSYLCVQHSRHREVR
jgi:peptide/nickel transport system ATP-binding protein